MGVRSLVGVRLLVLGEAPENEAGPTNDCQGGLFVAGCDEHFFPHALTLLYALTCVWCCWSSAAHRDPDPREAVP